MATIQIPDCKAAGDPARVYVPAFAVSSGPTSFSSRLAACRAGRGAGNPGADPLMFRVVRRRPPPPPPPWSRPPSLSRSGARGGRVSRASRERRCPRRRSRRPPSIALGPAATSASRASLGPHGPRPAGAGLPWLWGASRNAAGAEGAGARAATNFSAPWVPEKRPGSSPAGRPACHGHDVSPCGAAAPEASRYLGPDVPFTPRRRRKTSSPRVPDLWGPPPALGRGAGRRPRGRGRGNKGGPDLRGSWLAAALSSRPAPRERWGGPGLVSGPRRPASAPAPVCGRACSVPPERAPPWRCGSLHSRRRGGLDPARTAGLAGGRGLGGPTRETGGVGSAPAAEGGERRAGKVEDRGRAR